jgi:hypothetical protein
VEGEAVVELLARQFLDARDVLGRQIRAQLDFDTARLQLHVEGVFQVGGHGLRSCKRNDDKGDGERRPAKA